MTTQPSIDHIQAIDTLVFKIRTIINKADVIYLGNINNSNDSFRNLVKNAHHGTIEGTGLSWDPYWGFSNPDGSAYVDTHFSPANNGVKTTLNDCGMYLNLFNNHNSPPSGQYYAGSWQSGGMFTIRKGTATTTQIYLNDYTSVTLTSVPFFNGLFGGSRTSSSNVSIINQNLPKVTASINSGVITDVETVLFGNRSVNGVANPYYGGINFFYIGASLTDAEFTTLNNAVNDYLIECLIIKYGLSNWGVQMAISYFLNLHNFEKYEAWEVYEFIKRHQSDYNFIPPELSINSGASGMTDWVDSNGDGLADGWAVVNASTSIVSGNGFTGNAQRIDVSNNSGYLTTGISTMYLGKTYTFSGKYRSNNTWTITNVNPSGNNNWFANPSDAIPFSGTFTVGFSAVPRIGYMVNASDWLEIDEVSVKEVTESDVSTFNRCTNSGFGLGTDWINPTNGLAEGWTTDATPLTKSIVTGNGFTGNAQRVERITSTGNLYIYLSANPVLTIGKSYTLYLKYRSDITISLYNFSGIKYSDIGTANTGNAISVSVSFTATQARFYIGALNKVANSWFEIDEVCIIDNSNIQFLYNFFGPNGLNKSTADYLMLFKTGGNLNANAWTKTGATLRWNQDGTICNSNTMPAYARGTNLGIVTVTSTDGWDGVSTISSNQTRNSVNSFYGVFPLLYKLKNTSYINLNLYENKMKFNFSEGLYNLTLNILLYSIGYPPGYYTINLHNVTARAVSLYSNDGTTKTQIYGNINLIPFSQIQYYNIQGNGGVRFDGVSGTLENYDLINFTANSPITLTYCSITKGTVSWNKNISALYLTGCRLNTSALDNQLSVINNYFITNTPIKNLTIEMSTNPMGIPTGGSSNTDLLGIVTKHVAAGYTATITVRTS